MGLSTGWILGVRRAGGYFRNVGQVPGVMIALHVSGPVRSEDMKRRVLEGEGIRIEQFQF